MTWKEKMKDFGGGDLAFLSEDGEALTFVVVDEPVLLVGKYKGQPSEKVGCPIVTEDGFQLAVFGKRLARKITKHEAEFDEKAFVAIRHGEQDDNTTTYELKVSDDMELTAKLLAMREKEVSPEIIAEAIEAAQDVMKQ